MSGLVLAWVILPVGLAAQEDSTRGTPSPGLPVTAAGSIHLPAFAVDTNPPRPRVSMLSDGYYTRDRIHRIASYAALPIMATEYVLGEKLITDEQNGIRVQGALAGAHSAVATGLIGLFALNTVTGVLNLYEARHVSEGRARRTIHSVLMLVADGGFAYTASLGGGAKLPRSATGVAGTPLPGADQHKRAAIVSISVATAATLMMWLWKN